SAVSSKSHSAPNERQVRKQLQRMLESKLFKAQPSRAMLLEYLVEKTLAHAELSENTIGYDLFPNFEADVSNDVRVTAKNLRTSLADYYTSEGIEDLVSIDLPKGPKYLPVFGFNRHSALSQEYRRGVEMLSQLRLAQAEEHFMKVLEAEPAYPELYLALAHVYLLFSVCG